MIRRNVAIGAWTILQNLEYGGDSVVKAFSGENSRLRPRLTFDVAAVVSTLFSRLKGNVIEMDEQAGEFKEW